MKRGNKLLCAALPHQAELPELGPAGWGTQEGMGEDTVVAKGTAAGWRRVLCSLSAAWWDVWVSRGGIRTGLSLRSPFCGQVQVLILTLTLHEISKNIIEITTIFTGLSPS